MRDESGIIFDIDHFAAHDGPGIRTVVYFKGCPLKCLWCHSPESQKKEPQMLELVGGAKKMCGRAVCASELADELFCDKIFFDSSGGGVTLSGGEPLFQPEFAKNLIERLKKCEIGSIVETSGAVPWEDLRDIADIAEGIYYDIKTLDEAKHRAYTGAQNKQIQENLKKLSAYVPGKITLRVPLIPGHNDSVGEIAQIYRLAKNLGIKSVQLLPYNTSAPAKYEWLGLKYQPGSLERQGGDYLKILIEMAPNGINASVV
ncbi:MAG: radical SAM protein [Oscillospiraceae bacterium]|nr:radical SAM protein [Oscillospiraceae bacterium]